MNNLKNNIDAIVIAGPTASGKTKLALELAKKIDIEIISADSRQIYKEMDICTAKPSKEELEICPHHFIDIVSPDEYYSAGIFGNQANQKIKEIGEINRIPVIVGGSGLYIKSIHSGFFDEEYTLDEKRVVVRKELEQEYQQFGTEYIYNKLNTIDPVAGEIYIQRNKRRIMRAIEHYLITGEKFSDALKRTETNKANLKIYAIEYDREVLYNRINERTELMWQSGLIEETEYLLKKYDKSVNSLNTVGYKEVIAFLEGTFEKSEAIEKMKQNTRRYAKRQLTWFRNSENTSWLQESDFEKLADKIIEEVVES